MIRIVSLVAFALLSSATANAADDRIQTLVYDPDQIVRVVGRTGIQSTIEFAPDERIENVAVGDSTAWQVTPNRRASLIFLKPLVASSRTNMTVVTDRRTYMFDLVAGAKSSTPIYALKFTYLDIKPIEPAPKPVSPAVLASAPEPSALNVERLNFQWKMKGSGRLLPDRAFDDGSSLFLSWDRDTPLPAVLTVSDDRKEGSLNYQVAGDYIVIKPVPTNILLRYGTKSATLWPTRTPYRSRAVPPPSSPLRSPPTVFARSQVGAVTSRQVAAVNPPTAPAIANALQPAEFRQPPAPPRVALANTTSLYRDNLTDADHDQ